MVMDEKEKRIMGYFAEGMTRDQIATKEGNTHWKSVDMYLRRRNYSWDSEQQVYFKESSIAVRTDDEKLINQPQDYTKAGQIVRSLSQKGADIRLIAKQRGFTNHQGLADYMHAHRYKWDVEQSNYVKDIDSEREIQDKQDEPVQLDEISAASLPEEGTELPAHSQALLNYLLQNEQKLRHLIDEQGAHLPNYLVKGTRKGKTFQMSLLLTQLVEEYATTHAVTQREVVEIALVEFLQRYGYMEQVKQVLN